MDDARARHGGVYHWRDLGCAMTHPEIERAREMLDRLRNSEWQYAAEHAERDPLAECPLERWRALRAQSEPQEIQRPANALQLTDAMLDRRINDRIAKFSAENSFSEVQSQALVYVICDLRSYTREYVEQKLGELRAEIEVLVGVVKNNNVELIKRSKDVA
jgi:hypothetical protein